MENTFKYWLDLQRFDDGDDSPAPAADAGNGGANDKQEAAEKKYTDADIDRIIDKRFARWQQQQEKQSKDKTEAEKLAKMTADEKTAHKIEELEKKLQAAEAKEQRNSLAAVARTNLSEAGISVSDEILDTLVKEDAAATKTAVQSFVTAFNKAVDSKVKEALRGKTPSKAGNSTNKGMTKAQIMAVADRRERQRLINQNMHLFKKG